MWVKHDNKTIKPYVSRRSGANLHKAAQGLSPLANGLVGERLNEPSNSQGDKQCGIIIHTHKEGRGSTNVEQNSLKSEYCTAIRGNAVRERQSFTKGTDARLSNNKITTSKPDVSRRPGGNLH